MSHAGWAGQPVDVSEYLAGLDFPASREDLLREARRRGAGREVLDALTGLPERPYQSLAEVRRAYHAVGPEVDPGVGRGVDDLASGEAAPPRRRAG